MSCKQTVGIKRDSNSEIFFLQDLLVSAVTLNFCLGIEFKSSETAFFATVFEDK